LSKYSLHGAWRRGGRDRPTIVRGSRNSSGIYCRTSRPACVARRWHRCGRRVRRRRLRMGLSRRWQLGRLAPGKPARGKNQDRKAATSRHLSTP
jgi:hypothetical protein